MKKEKLNFKKAFTLVETLVAVTILSIAVVGPMFSSAQNIKLASFSQNQLVAFYLGQEAIEYVRNVRDTNLINLSGDWLNGLTVCKGATGCYIDIIKIPVTVNVCATSCPKLDFNGVNYTYKSGGADGNSIFTRTVKIDNAVRVDGDEAKISIFVNWKDKDIPKTMNLQDNIFNWR